MYKTLINKLNKYKNICIYRHVRPDGDAVFSQFALAQFIKDNFKGKHIEICGEMEYDLLPYSNIPDDKLVRKSLVFVLDTANSSRVDGHNFIYGDYLIKIDHHIFIEKYANLEIINEKCASTTEVLSSIFFSKEFKNYKLSKQTCMYLYAGLLTDSNCFSTSNTTSNTLMYASKLAEIGEFDISALNNYLFDQELYKFKGISLYRNCLKVEDGVGYIIADKKLLNKLKITFNEAKNAIDEFNHIKGLKIWSVFAYNKESGLFDGSVRSNKAFNINNICIRFNGGGHKNACGVKNLTLAQVKKLIKGLKDIANN